MSSLVFTNSSLTRALWWWWWLELWKKAIFIALVNVHWNFYHKKYYYFIIYFIGIFLQKYFLIIKKNTILLTYISFYLGWITILIALYFKEMNWVKLIAMNNNKIVFKASVVAIPFGVTHIYVCMTTYVSKLVLKCWNEPKILI